MADKLSPKQLRFVEEYLVDMNGTQAAIRAGYSPRTANEQAARLLAHVSVSKAVSNRLQKRQKKLELTQERVLRELMRVAFFDPRALFTADGRPRSIEELDDDTAAVIAGLDIAMERTEEETEDGRPIYAPVRKYKVSDKMKALELCMRHMGLLNDKLKVDGTLTLAQLLEAAERKERGE